MDGTNVEFVYNELCFYVSRLDKTEGSRYYYSSGEKIYDFSGQILSDAGRFGWRGCNNGARIMQTV